MQKNLFALAGFLALLSFPCHAADAPMPPPIPSPEDMQKMRLLNPGPSVFAFSGASCPAGSEPYRGPEQDLVKDSGLVYCVFAKKVHIFPKNLNKECPPGMKKYKSKAKPGGDMIWCEQDLSYKPPAPPMPPAPSAAPQPATPPPSPPPPLPSATPETQKPSSSSPLEGLKKLFK